MDGTICVRLDSSGSWSARCFRCHSPSEATPDRRQGSLPGGNDIVRYGQRSSCRWISNGQQNTPTEPNADAGVHCAGGPPRVSHSGVFLVFLFVTLFGGDFGDAAFAGFDVVAVGVFAVLMWRQSRLQVVGHDTDLHVVNYPSTFLVPWDSIERFDSPLGYWDIRVMMKDGRIIRLNAITKCGASPSG